MMQLPLAPPAKLDGSPPFERTSHDDCIAQTRPAGRIPGQGLREVGERDAGSASAQPHAVCHDDRRHGTRLPVAPHDESEHAVAVAAPEHPQPGAAVKEGSTGKHLKVRIPAVVHQRVHYLHGQGNGRTFAMDARSRSILGSTKRGGVKGTASVHSSLSKLVGSRDFRSDVTAFRKHAPSCDSVLTMPSRRAPDCKIMVNFDAKLRESLHKE